MFLTEGTGVCVCLSMCMDGVRLLSGSQMTPTRGWKLTMPQSSAERSVKPPPMLNSPSVCLLFVCACVCVCARLLCFSILAGQLAVQDQRHVHSRVAPQTRSAKHN